MIGSLRGILLERTAAGAVLVEVGAVGYRAAVPPGTLAALGEVGSEIFLHTHLHVREDALLLYGFASRDERVCFEALIGAHGVGPSLALAVLSVHRPDALRRALAEDDVGALCLVPGVGKKTATRLLVELKARFDVPEVDVDAVVGVAGAVPAGGVPSAPSPRAEVRAALTSLGYGPDEVREALRELPDEGDVAILVKQALRALSRVG